MTQEELRKRLKLFISLEGVNQKHISDMTDIGTTILSRFKNEKCELGLLDRESLDEYLKSKGY